MGNLKIYEKEWFNKLNELIDANLERSNINVNDLAYQMHTSPSSLYRKVTKLSGSTPSDYIRKRKLEKAKFLLESADEYNMNEVCEKVGYNKIDFF